MSSFKREPSKPTELIVGVPVIFKRYSREKVVLISVVKYYTNGTSECEGSPKFVKIQLGAKHGTSIPAKLVLCELWILSWFVE